MMILKQPWGFLWVFTLHPEVTECSLRLKALFHLKIPISLIPQRTKRAVTEVAAVILSVVTVLWTSAAAGGLYRAWRDCLGPWIYSAVSLGREKQASFKSQLGICVCLF